MQKVPTRVHTQTPFTNFWTAKNLHGSAFSLHATHGTCKRICTFPLNVAFILCGPCKGHSEKEVSRKNNDWMGYGVRVVRTPLMVVFDKSSFRILPVYQILVNPMNGLFWQLLSTFEGLLPYGNAKWQRWDHQLEGLLSKKYYVRWLSWPLCGLKCPPRTLIQLHILCLLPGPSRRLAPVWKCRRSVFSTLHC